MDDLHAELDKGILRLLYVLTGPEQLLRREAQSRICALALENSPKEFNETRMVMKETHGDAIVDACRTYPMMGARRLVVVSGIESLKTKDSEALAKYFLDPSPTTCLVLVVESVDARVKIWKDAAKVGRIEKFEAPRSYQLAPWIEARARRKSIKIHADAAALLGDVIGTDLSALEEALERLYLYAATGDKPEKDKPKIVEVNLGHVENCIARTRVHTVFELGDALGKKDTKIATRILEAMLAAKESPIGILTMVARHFRRLWQASEVLNQGGNPDDVARELGLHPFVAKEFVSQARLFSSPDFARLLERCFATDRLLKSSKLGDELHLFNLVLEVCGGGAPRRGYGVR